MSQDFYRIDMPIVPVDPSATVDLSTGTTRMVSLNLLRVPPAAPYRHRAALERIGRYFRRELGYDFDPYDAQPGRQEEEQIGFLFFGRRSGFDPERRQAHRRVRIRA